MSRFYNLRRNLKYGKCGKHEVTQEIQQKFISNGTDERIPKLKSSQHYPAAPTKIQHYDDRLNKPFLLNLLRSSKRFKGINSRWGRSHEEMGSIQSLDKMQISRDFMDAVLNKFRKSDKFALSIFNTIGALKQEIKLLKDFLSEPYSSQFRSESPRNFEIDSLTDQFIKEFIKAGLSPDFTSPAYIYILDSPEDMNIILETITRISKSIQGGLSVVGLDVETGLRSNYSSFPSILQIAVNKNIVIIFQVRLIFINFI